MLIEIGVVLAIVLPVMFVGKQIAIQFWQTSKFVATVQSALGAIIAYAIAVELTLSVPIVVAGGALLPLIINIAATYDNKRQKRKTLDGDYGDQARWAAELVEHDEDYEFAFAMQSLSDMDRREIGVIAESKEELRELTMERFEEHVDDNIPEDFA